jgi:hypothetical protein
MDSPHDVPNELLRRGSLPTRDDDQLSWIGFALTFDGYAETGSFDACAKLANATRSRWEKTGELPTRLSELRSVLFFEQRRWRHSAEEPFTDDEWQYWEALVGAIALCLPE